MNEELKQIVTRMVASGESEDNIALVIRNYKPKETSVLEGVGHFVSGINEAVYNFPGQALQAVGVIGNKAYNLLPGEDTPVEQDFLYQAGTKYLQGVEELNKAGYGPSSGKIDQLSTSEGATGFFMNDIPQGLGSVATILMTGGGSLVPKLGMETALQFGGKSALRYATEEATKKVATTMASRGGIAGSVQMGIPEYDAAIAAGMSEDEAFEVFAKNYLLGATEVLPISDILSRVNKVTGNKLMRRLKTGGIGAFEEAVQEGLQQLETNNIAAGSYDPDRNPTDGLIRAMLAGGLIGGAIGGGASTISPEIEIDNTIELAGDTQNPALNNQIDEIVKQSEPDALQIKEAGSLPVQSETGGSQEIQSTQPQAEPQEAPQEIQVEQLAQEFNETGTLLGQTEESAKVSKEVAVENVADFLRQKNVTTREQVDSFVDSYNNLQVEGKPVLKASDAGKVFNLLQAKPVKGEMAPQRTIAEELKFQVQNFYRGVEKGTRKGQQLVNEQLLPKLTEALKTAKLTPRQTSSILTKIKNTNLFTPGSISKLNTFVDKVTGDAEYAEKLSVAKRYQKRLKKFARSKSDAPVNYKTVARAFASLDPTRIDKIDDYLTKAESIVAGFRPVTSKNYAKVNVTETEQFVDENREPQLETGELVDESLPERDIKAELQTIADNTKERLDSKDLSGFDDSEKRTVNTIKKVDTARLNDNQLKRFIRTVDNIVENDDLSGVAFIENIASIQAFFDKFKGVLSKNKVTPRIVSETGHLFYNIEQKLKAIFQNDEAETIFKAETGLQDMIIAGSKMERAVVETATNFDKELKKLNKKYKTELRDIDNKADQVVFSLLYQMDNDADMAKMHRNIENTIERHRLSDETSEEYRAWVNAHEKFKNVKTPQEAKSIIMTANPAVYEMWKFFGVDEESKSGVFSEELKDKSAKNSREVFNREYTDVVHYTPIVQHQLNTIVNSTQTLIDKDGIPAAEQLKARQATTAKKRTLALRNNSVYTLEPYADWVNRYGETVYDNEASRYESKVGELIQSPEFSSIVGDGKQAAQLAKDYAVVSSIQRGRHRSLIDDNAGKFLESFSKVVRSIGTAKALGSLSQVVKQSTVYVKTMANLWAKGDTDMIFPAIRYAGHPNVKKLLDETTVQVRGLRLGGTDRGDSAAYQISRGAKQNVVKFLQHTRHNVDSAVKKSLGFLVWGDKKAATVSFISYYLSELRRQGVKNIDLTTEYLKVNDPERRQAIAFAENQLAQTQTASNPAAHSRLQRQASTESATIIKNIFLPFSSFDTDFKARLVNETNAMVNNKSGESLKKWLGTMAEAVGFAALNAFLLYYYKEGIKTAVRELAGVAKPEPDDEDEEKEKIFANKMKQFNSSIFGAINPLAIGTIGQNLNNMVINEIAFNVDNPDELSKREWLKKNAVVYEPREESFVKSLGVYSVGMSPLIEAGMTAPQVKSFLGEPVKVSDGYGNSKIVYLTKEQQAIMSTKFLIESLASMGLTEADVANAVRAVYKEQIKIAMQEGETPE